MIRSAEPGDLDALAGVELSCFGAGAWSRALVEAELLAETREVYVAIQDACVVGYGSVLIAGDSADLQRIAICAEQRGHGLARRLLGRLFDAARLRGAERILLEVSAANVAATTLYESIGFTMIARRVRYYADGTDALVMSMEPGHASHETIEP